jgi:hypothetical protein
MGKVRKYVENINILNMITKRVLLKKKSRNNYNSSIKYFQNTIEELLYEILV